MDDFELGYVVGLYEGEGTFTAGRLRRNWRRGRPRIRVSMRDLDPLEKLQRYTGMGTLREGKTPKGYPYYRWQVGKVHEAFALAAEMYPHLSRRRQEQIWRVLRESGREDEFPCAHK